MLSLESLFLVYAFFLFFAGAFASIIYRGTKDIPTKYLAYSCYIYSIGLIIIIFREKLNPWIGFGLGNFLPILSIYLIHLGLQSTSEEFKFQPKKTFFALILFCAYSATFPILLIIDLSVYFPVLAGVGLGIANLLVITKIPEEVKRKNIIYFRLITFTSFALASAWLIRAFFALSAGITYALDPTIGNWILSSCLLFLGFVRVISFMGMRLDNSYEHQKTLERLNSSLFDAVKERNEIHAYSKELENGMLDALNKLAKERDNETGNHIIRTQHYVRLIAQRLHDLGQLEGNHPEDFCEILFKAAPLHDIGKVGIPDAILLKPGKLNDEEWEVMKTHTTIGEKVLASASNNGQLNSEILKVSIEISGAHHESWNGSGYPKGLSGKNIPQSARIMRVADVYDALRSNRPYKEPWSHFETIDYITLYKNIKFDPEVIEALLYLSPEFEIINRKFED